MSAFECNKIEVPVGLLEIDNDSHPSDLYDHLKMVDNKLLKGLAKKWFFYRINPKLNSKQKEQVRNFFELN
jgi:hypothetical protein